MFTVCMKTKIGESKIGESHTQVSRLDIMSQLLRSLEIALRRIVRFDFMFA